MYNGELNVVGILVRLGSSQGEMRSRGELRIASFLLSDRSW